MRHSANELNHCKQQVVPVQLLGVVLGAIRQLFKCTMALNDAASAGNTTVLQANSCWLQQTAQLQQLQLTKCCRVTP